MKNYSIVSRNIFYENKFEIEKTVYWVEKIQQVF